MSTTQDAATSAAADGDWPTDLVRISQFAADIGVHVSTVHRWRLDGLKRQPGRTFPAIRIGGVWFVSRKAGREYLAAGQPHPNWLAASLRDTERRQQARRRRRNGRAERYLDHEGI